ncbi:MAG: PLP-dependent aminotransferase family protein, partial [Sphingobacterium sp.]
PDIRLTQIDDLSRIYSSNLKRKSNRAKMGYNQEGSEYFKEQLTHYLQLSRGLQICKDNLLITRSVEMSLYIISEILLEKDDLVVVGELSYFSANMIFQKSGSKIMTIPVDAEGIDTEALAEICEKKNIRMLYLTPQQHYPTTVSLSAQRRMEVLQLAKKYGFIILEDDHTYDFQYDKQALMPIASNDQDGMVIYVGSFGQSLAPGFRTGFIVAPSNLMMEMRKHLGIIDRQGDILMELALGEMIEEGAIHRHLKKSLKIYRERRDHLAKLLTTELADEVNFQLPSGGLAIWITWKLPINLMKLSQIAYKNNLFIPRTLLFQKINLSAMRIGFGHLNFDEMQKAISILKDSLKQVKEING